MKELIFATANEGKMKEIRMILEDLGYDVLSLNDMQLDITIEENGVTFEENAVIKAKVIMEITNKMVLADDSGLEIDFLDKAPGVYSARYMGEETSYDIKNQHIIELLQGIEEERRTARFVSVIACAFPDGQVFTTRGTIEGLIGNQQKGSNGFGYDPIFFVPEYKCTMAELTPEQKNSISHRGKALEAMKSTLMKRGV